MPVELISKTFTFEKDTLNKTIVSDSLLRDYYFQRLDTVNKHGFLFNYRFKEEDIKSRPTLIIKGKIRSNYIYSNAAIIAIMTHDNIQVHWLPINLRTQIVDLNVWNKFYDSILLPKSTNEYPINSIAVESFLGDSKNENFDLDSVTIIIKR